MTLCGLHLYNLMSSYWKEVVSDNMKPHYGDISVCTVDYFPEKSDRSLA